MGKIQAFERNYLANKKQKEAIKLAERKEHLKKENKMKSYSVKKEREQAYELAKKLGLKTVVEYKQFMLDHQFGNETELDCLKREWTKQNLNPIFKTIITNMGFTR